MNPTGGLVISWRFCSKVLGGPRFCTKILGGRRFLAALDTK